MDRPSETATGSEHWAEAKIGPAVPSERPPSTGRIEVFYSFARQDVQFARWLSNHLRILWRQGVISDWQHEAIGEGESFEEASRKHLEDAHVILPLISPDYLSSKTTRIEMEASLQRHRTGAARVVPILIRPAPWYDSPFGRLQVLPSDARPVTDWPNVDEAFANVAAGIKAIVQELLPQAGFGLAASVPIPESDPRELRTLPPAWNVPFVRNPAFVGREAILSGLHETFKGADTSSVQVIYGLAGSGKTSVAVEYAYRYAADYRIVWWIRAEQPTTCASDFAALAWRAGLPERSWPGQDAVAAAVGRWLATRSGWLLVFDNANNPSAIVRYMPPDGTGDVMVTSRRSDWEGIGTATELGGLDAEAAIDLIANNTGQSSANAAGALAMIQGAIDVDVGIGSGAPVNTGPSYSPLALEHAAAYLNATGMPVGDFAAALDEATKRQPGRVEAQTDELVTVELEGRAAPYLRVSGMGGLAQDVPPGPYLARLRIGAEVFDEFEVFVGAGETIGISASRAPSPLAREVMEWEDRSSAAADSARSIHPGVLDGFLARVGTGLFDGDEVVSSVEPIRGNREWFKSRPLSIVLALDGDDWEDTVQAVRASTRVRLGPAGLGPDKGASEALSATIGLSRVGSVLVTAPRTSFRIEVSAPSFGTISFATFALADRCLLVTIRIHSAGRVDVTQNYLQLDGHRDLELRPEVPFNQLMERLQVGQLLYRSQELLPTGPVRAIYEFRQLFEAKWTDPILSCMAFYSILDAQARGDPAVGEQSDLLEKLGWNLIRHFGDLPDARVVHALSTGKVDDRALDGVLKTGDVPLLSRSTEVLASRALATGNLKVPVLEWHSQLVVDCPWTMTWHIDDAPAASARSAEEEADLDPGEEVAK